MRIKQGKGQPIREDGPARHIVEKQGTPTMGGLMILASVLVSTLLWVLMATGMSVYLAYSGSYSLTYGALAGIVITMLFLYFSGAIIIFGAELNAAIRRYREKNT